MSHRKALERSPGGAAKTITMTELRAEPGERIRDVSRNGEAFMVTKAGKLVAILAPVGDADVTTTIECDGTIVGPVPLTFRNSFLHRLG